MSKYRILLLLACLLVAFSGYCTELGKLVQDAYGESPSTTQSPTKKTAVEENKTGDKSTNSGSEVATIVAAVVSAIAALFSAIATIFIAYFNQQLAYFNKQLVEETRRNKLAEADREVQRLIEQQVTQSFRRAKEEIADLQKAMKEAKANIANLQATNNTAVEQQSSPQDKEQLRGDFLRLKGEFEDVAGTRALIGWYNRLVAVYQRTITTFSDNKTRELFTDLVDNLGWRFFILDNRSQSLETRGFKLSPKEERLRKSLLGKIPTRLQEIETYLQAEIDGKEQTPDGTH